MEETKKSVRKLYFGGTFFVIYLISNIREIYQLWLTRNIEPGANYTQQAILLKTISAFLLIFIIGLFIYYRLKLISDIDLKILKLSKKIYSEETVKFCFEPLMIDWKNEYTQTISQNKYWQAKWIWTQYFIALFIAIVRQSYLGKIIEFILK